MEGIYRFKQTAPEIQELLDKVPENAAGIEENRVAIEELSAEVDALKEREIRVTYWELVSKLQSAKLVSGKVYRITDYETVVPSSITNAQSAGHVFDVLVTAIAENALSEDARAIHHDNDDYFYESAVKSWQLKYSLWNDTTRFSWADEVNGKGVIYWMKDEFGNEAPYDFKNVQVKRWRVTDSAEWRGIEGYMGVLDDLPEGLTIEDESDWQWCYTFDKNGADASLTGGLVHDNVIGSNLDEHGKSFLSGNVLYGSSHDNTFGSGCTWNTFGSATRNTFGSGCSANVIMSMESNSVGNSFWNNGGNTMTNCRVGENVYENRFAALWNVNVGNNVNYNVWRGFSTSSIGNGVESTTTDVVVVNAEILDGVSGRSGQPLSIPFAAGSDNQCAGVSGGVLKVWKPGERGLRVVEVEATFPTFTLNAEVGKYYRLDGAETLNLVLPVPDATDVASVVLGVPFSGGASLTVTSEADVRYQDGFEIEEMTNYEINCLWNGLRWVVAAMKIAEA